MISSHILSPPSIIDRRTLDQLTVGLAEHNFRHDSVDDDDVFLHAALDVRMHPLFDPATGSSNVALIRISDALCHLADVCPVCLSPSALESSSSRVEERSTSEKETCSRQGFHKDAFEELFVGLVGLSKSIEEKSKKKKNVFAGFTRDAQLLSKVLAEGKLTVVTGWTNPESGFAEAPLRANFGVRIERDCPSTEAAADTFCVGTESNAIESAPGDLTIFVREIWDCFSMKI